TTLTLDDWNHIVITQNGTLLKAYVNVVSIFAYKVCVSTFAICI
ncbi:unnamed protein product, partial [marine sediment metagenome]